MAEIWVNESRKTQPIAEAIAYTIDYSDIGTPTGAGTVVAINSAGTDVSSTLLSGSASLSGDIVKLKVFTPSTAGYYRLINTVVISGNTVKGGVEVDVFDPAAAQTITGGYATLAEFKHYLGVEASSVIDDNVIIDLIEAASRLIDIETGRVFYSSTGTYYYSVPFGRKLELDRDLLSITTLTNGDTETISSSYYHLLPKNETPKRAILLKESSSIYWAADSNNDTEFVISVAGSWGWATTTPDDIKQACLDIVKMYYKRRFGENESSAATVTDAGIVITPQDIPASAWRIIRRYRVMY